MRTRSFSNIHRACAAIKGSMSALALAVVASLAMTLLAGCETTMPSAETLNAQAAAVSAPLNLREGDQLKISFPGSPTLNTSQQIRRDGKISMPLVGEVDAAGMPTAALEKKLVDLYAPQLVTKQVTVEIVNSSFQVYVTGMVLRPGKIISDHPLTVLEAIMEAGGFDYGKANLKGVTVIRREGSNMQNYIVNLKLTLEGKESQPFFLEPSDIVFVPERFAMF